MQGQCKQLQNTLEGLRAEYDELSGRYERARRSKGGELYQEHLANAKSCGSYGSHSQKERETRATPPQPPARRIGT